MTTLRECFEMFSFSVVQTGRFSCFTHVVITVPASSLVHNLRLERAVKPVLVGEKRVNAVSVTKNYF